MKVVIRKLRTDDAIISWVWRNDLSIWKLTAKSWNTYVNYETELKWIQSVLLDKTRLTYAICVGQYEEYIGNVQLTNINSEDACFHIFIGNKNYWGKGIGMIATKLFIDHVKNNLNIKKIYLYVKETNTAALSIYNKVGFVNVGLIKSQIKMELKIKNEQR